MSIIEEDKRSSSEVSLPSRVGRPAEQLSVEPPTPGPPPDGGTVAWLQVASSWCLFFNTWGILNTFGVFQTYYESKKLFHASSSTIAWIGSIQAVMVLFFGAVAGPIYDGGHFRLLLIVGSFLVVFGFMMTSLVHTFWQALLAQGFCIGLGGGALFVPAIAIMPTYFSKKLGLAMGLAASGSSVGGIIYPIMFYKLLPQAGFGWSVRALGFTSLATLMIPLAFMRMRVQPAKARALVDTTAFTDTPYILTVISTLIGFVGLYVGFFYSSFYGQDARLTSDSLAFYLVPILNAGSVFGRTLPSWLSDKIGPLNVMIPGTLMVAVLLFCNIAVHNAGGLVVTVLLFGFFSGVFIALPPIIMVATTADKTKVGSRMGMGFAIFGLGVLIGGPGGGSVLQQSGWRSTWIFGGVFCLASGTLFCIVRFIRNKNLIAKC
ncbi:MFS general substrate transporter [Piedraia hortae CBS 480.64]|uniref:MFS general substrate transporter n=1 Tax=Piedraia hortae CBS 480.64 TaxID=1314780 RepID=A0A6A7C718_9PEZI|nr:MFS general substrate transporter [Piedraia hortae CBS 480.64]